jgi:hypothetical protein
MPQADDTRSYVAIRPAGQRLSVLFVNPARQRFMMLPKVLLGLRRHAGELVQVKRRNRHPNRAVQYHGGDIAGLLTIGGDDATVELFYGEIARDLAWEAQAKMPREYIHRESYRLPLSELDCVCAVIEMMDDQQSVVEGLDEDAVLLPEQGPRFKPTDS